MKKLLVLLITMLAMAACATGQPVTPQVAETFEISQLEDITLTISSPSEWLGLEHFARMYMDKNPGVTIELNTWDGDFMRYHEQKSLTLMAGTADDLMDSSGFDIRDPSTQALLADWFPVMRADPNFNDDNFFVNVFEAMAENGRLYNLPTAFYPTRIAYNTTIPGLSAEMDGRRTLTLTEMHAIHRAFAPENIFIHDSYDLLSAIGWNIHKFVDFENRTASFNSPAFIDFITEVKALTHPDQNLGWLISRTYYDPELMAENSHKYLFQQQFTGDPFQFLIPFEEKMTFHGSIPKANERGEVLIQGFPSYVLNGRTSPEVRAVAWDFMSFILNPAQYKEPDFDAGFFAWVSMVPVSRPLLRFGLERQLPGWIRHLNESYGWRPVFDEDETLEYVYNLLSELGNMPLAHRVYTTDVVSGIIHEVLRQFHEGLITAEQAAEDLQNGVTLALMEIG